MKPDTIATFIEHQTADDRLLCETLRAMIDAGLPEAESKIWHAHPVWFLEGNPIVGFSRAGFSEVKLRPGTGKFMDASIIYSSAEQINAHDLTRWLDKARQIQWDYKNLIRNRRLVRLK